jgi:hypothetical protein
MDELITRLKGITKYTDTSYAGFHLVLVLIVLSKAGFKYRIVGRTALVTMGLFQL